MQMAFIMLGQHFHLKQSISFLCKIIYHQQWSRTRTFLILSPQLLRDDWLYWELNDSLQRLFPARPQMRYFRHPRLVFWLTFAAVILSTGDKHRAPHGVPWSCMGSLTQHTALPAATVLVTTVHFTIMVWEICLLTDEIWYTSHGNYRISHFQSTNMAQRTYF